MSNYNQHKGLTFIASSKEVHRNGMVLFVSEIIFNDGYKNISRFWGTEEEWVGNNTIAEEDEL